MITNDKIERQIYKRMTQICSRSEQCSSDIRKKMIAAGLTDEQAGEVLNELIQEKFIDDERYVKAYVADKFRINKWGKIKIRYYLKSKGLDDDVIQVGLDEIDDEKYKQVLLKVLKDKAKSVKKKNKYEKMGQIIRFAQGRGFEPEMIHRHLNEILD